MARLIMLSIQIGSTSKGNGFNSKRMLTKRTIKRGTGNLRTLPRTLGP